ncbi:hypothetical protein GCM10009834_34970 [Streptomonospora arabica]|uniref:Uncharacterized protein n=1 Tax=Streptomonospora halophila TaxID=427369 RepID=A0ABP9GYS2_9ACTN
MRAPPERAAPRFGRSPPWHGSLPRLVPDHAVRNATYPAVTAGDVAVRSFGTVIVRRYGHRSP